MSAVGVRRWSGALAGLCAGAVAVVACGSGPRASSDALPSLPPPRASGTLAPLPSPASSPAPAPSAAATGPRVETFDLAGGEAIGVDRPAAPSPTDALAPPPSAKVTLAPAPSRPPGADPSPADASRVAAACAAIKDCGACENAGYCGFCLQSGRCVPKDRHGPYPGTCSAGFGSCGTLYDEREEPKVRERLAASTRGMSPAGPPIDTSAEGLGKPVGGLGREVRRIRVPVARGFCYALAIRGSYDLDVQLNPQVTVGAPYHEDGGDLVTVGRGASAVTRFCPQEPGSVFVLLWQDHRDPLPAITHGVLRVQVFREPISTAELDARAAAASRKDRRDWVRYVCGHCMKVLLACKLAGEAGCSRQQDWCMQQGKVTPAECEGAEPGARPAKPPWDI